MPKYKERDKMLITLKNKAVLVIFQIPILIALITMVVGCDREEELILDLKAPIALKCDGSTVELSQLAIDNINHFFAENAKGWRRTPVSYTRKVTLVSENYTVQVIDNAVVVNSNKSQYVKKIEEDSFFKKLCK